MTPFDFLFTLFGLVLGLAMAEALGGFVRALKARTRPDHKRAHVRIGWLLPMLTVAVCIDLITCWALAWSIRTDVPMTLPVMVVGTAFVAIYFTVAGLLWPDEPCDWPDLDDWFDRQKATIGVLLTVANVGFSAISFFGGRYTSFPYVQLLYIALLFSLALTRSRRQSLIVLATILSVFVWVSFYSLYYWRLQ
jgi:predicted Kef-type K+ transport protein